MKILINGIGTVGSRVARLLLSSGVHVHGVKYSVRHDDRKTLDLLHLYKEFGKFPLSPANGGNYASRQKSFIDMGFSVSDYDYSNFDAVIDATSNEVTVQNVTNYPNHYLVQGGTDYDLLKNDFVSAPNTVGHKSFAAFCAPTRQVSCNTTFCSTALGLVLETVDSANIRHVDVTLRRRCRDPGENKPLVDKPELKSSHHASDVMYVIPELEGKVHSIANKNAWEHFHVARIEVNFNEDVDARAVAASFESYPRCISLQTPLSANPRDAINILLGVSSALNIPDGDTLLPVYHVEKVNRKKLCITGYTPQRSIVALSCLDWLFASKLSWQEAFGLTNSTCKWHGYSVKGLKHAYEQKLRSLLLCDIKV